MMFRRLFAVVLLVICVLGMADSVAAQDPCTYWFGSSSCRIDGVMAPSPYMELRDFLPSRGTILPWKTSLDKETALGIQLLQKPRFVLWVQPIQRVWGFKLFFDF